MEEVDRIIIHSLKDIGCDIDNEIQTLGQFTTDLIVDAASRCLDTIQPGTDIPRSLPQNMASRFHVGSSLAEACKNLGYNGDVGYQTFLYSNVVDVRRVFMFLIEKLPREAEKAPLDEFNDPVTKLKLAFAREVKIGLSTKYVPIAVSSIPFTSVPLETGIIAPGTKIKGNPKDWREYVIKNVPFLTEQTTYKKLLPSIITLNEIGLFGKISETKSKDVTPSSSANDIVGLTKSKSEPSAESSWLSLNESLLYSKGTIKPVDLKIDETEKTEKTSLVLNNLNADINNRKEKIETVDDIRITVEELQTKIKETNDIIEKVNEDYTKELKIAGEKSKEIALHEKALLLLPEADSNLKQLEESTSSLSEKIVSLSKQWESYRKPLMDKYISARNNMTSKESQNEEEHEKIKQIKGKIEVLNKQLLAKRGIISQLEEEYEKLPKNINRSAYTRRIMEIIGNITKQKDQIDKILSDTKALQKEINALNGKLERLFAVTEETIYRNARKDAFSKRAFKLLATLHSDCSTIVSLVLEIGTVTREITDLKEQIELESRKNTTANLERITADLEQMRAESKSLKNQIHKVHTISSDTPSHPLQ